MRHIFYLGAALAALHAVSASAAGAPETGPVRTYQLPAQELSAALRAFAAASGR
jgi:hypothetical protein